MNAQGPTEGPNGCWIEHEGDDTIHINRSTHGNYDASFRGHACEWASHGKALAAAKKLADDAEAVLGFRPQIVNDAD